MADQNPIQTIVQLKKIDGDSIQSIIQFKYQVIIYTGRIRKFPEKCPKFVQIRQKVGLLKIESIDSIYYSFSSFLPKFNSKDY